MVPSPTPPAAVRAPARVLDALPPAAAALAALGRRGCRWPLGEPAEAAFRFCGAARLARGAYCAAHARAARRRRPGR